MLQNQFKNMTLRLINISGYFKAITIEVSYYTYLQVITTLHKSMYLFKSQYISPKVNISLQKSIYLSKSQYISPQVIKATPVKRFLKIIKYCLINQAKDSSVNFGEKP